MIKKQQIAILSVALLILGVGYAAFCVLYDRYEERQHTRPQRMEAERQSRLNQRVHGYISDEAVLSSTFRMASIDYFGGHLQEWEYADGSVIYRERPGMPGTPVENATIQLDENQRLLLADVLNLVVKQELWNQTDLQELADDGSEQTYEFSIGGHNGQFKVINGQFKVINTEPPHLDVFRHKCWRLMGSIKEASRIQNHNKSMQATPNGAPDG